MQRTRSIDYLIDGIINKIKFLDNYEKEVIVYVDQHEILPDYVKQFLFSMIENKRIHSLVINSHREYYKDFSYYPKHNDISYLQALAMARGEYIMHFDADVAAFVKDRATIDNWLQMLINDTYDYISYPSHWSPKAVDDPRYDYRWVSTRFFMCKKDVIDYTEIDKCLRDSDYLYSKYGTENSAKSPWMEHILGLISYGENFVTPDRVYYPPIDNDKYLIFSWGSYRKGTLDKLNNMEYNSVKQFVETNGGIHYPCNVTLR